MGSGINQTNTHAGPVASMLFSRDRDDEEYLRRTNPTIGIDGLERSQLTFSSLASGLHNTFPWQSSYCPTSSFLDSGFSASTMQAMDLHHRQTLYSLLDRDFARRAMALNHESLNQLQLERYNRFRLDSSSNGFSSRRSSDIDVQGFVADPRAVTMMDTSLESTSTRQHSLPVGHQIYDQALLDGKFHTDASNHAIAVSLAGARAHQEFMLQANQIPFGPTGARIAGVMSSSSSDIGGASRLGGLGKIDYSHRVQQGGTTSATPPKDSKNGEGSTTSGCGGLSLASVVRNNPPSDHRDITNYHSHSTIHRGLPVLRSDADIHSYHRSPTHSPSVADHPELAINAALVAGDKKLSSPKSHSQNDNSMDSRRKKDEDTPSKRKHEAKSLQSTKKNKPRDGAAKVSLSNKRRKRGDQCTEESASHGSHQTRKSWGKEEACNASVLEEEKRPREARQKLAENLCLDSAAGRGYHPQLRQTDEEQRNLHHAILADQECIRSCLLRNTMPVLLPLQYHRSRYPYHSTRALLENVTSAFFPPRGSSALGSIGVQFGADSDPAFGCRISQSLPSGEEQLPEETYSGAMEQPFRDSNSPGQVYPSAREAVGSRDFARRGRCFPLHIREDENNLSSYQVLARKQIEVFEASIEEARTNAQGRNRPIQPGEIGIRCRHCAKLSPKDRVTGAVYYPKKLDGVYQTAQKMAVNHLVDRCQEIPEETKQRLRSLKDTTRSSDGGGKRYWAEALRTLGVRELDSGGLVWNE